MTPDSTTHRRRFVTLRIETGESCEVEMPGDRPVGALLPDLWKALPWADDQRDAPGVLVTEEGHVLRPDETLLQAGVENADALWLRPGQDGPAWTPASPPALTPAPPPDLLLPEAALASPSGVIYLLTRSPICVGRPGQEHQPELDLTELEAQLQQPVSSRRHAEVWADGGRHLLAALPTTNGTFVNGVEVPPGERRVLVTGDVVSFGFQGVALTYFAAGSSVSQEFFDETE